MADKDNTNRTPNSTQDKSKQTDLPPRNVSKEQQDKVKGGYGGVSKDADE